MGDPIDKKVAEQELQRIIDFWEVDPEGETWETSKKRLIFAIQKGRISFDEEPETVSLTLVKPIEREKPSDGLIDTLVFHEPTAADLRCMDKYKENETMAKTLHLASRMCGHPVGIVDRMHSRDVSTMGAIAALFF